jgi:hypothetical protein
MLHEDLDLFVTYLNLDNFRDAMLALFIYARMRAHLTVDRRGKRVKKTPHATSLN